MLGNSIKVRSHNYNDVRFTLLRLPIIMMRINSCTELFVLMYWGHACYGDTHYI